MLYQTIVGLFSFLLLITTCSSNKSTQNDSSQKTAQAKQQTMPDGLETATFGAGCFWCVEAVFEELKGVHSVVSGYTGGSITNPTYKQICSGNTGHAEVAQIHYNPTIITFAELLEVFWTTHDPTTLNRQGNDAGTQYRSAIFYHNEIQKSVAEKSIKEVAPLLWNKPIVTEITPLGVFYAAENYHQDYYTLNPNYGYCVAVINPKLEKFRKRFKDKLKTP